VGRSGAALSDPLGRQANAEVARESRQPEASRLLRDTVFLPVSHYTPDEYLRRVARFRSPQPILLRALPLAPPLCRALRLKFEN
jgi:hypothetical protein